MSALPQRIGSQDVPMIAAHPQYPHPGESRPTRPVPPAGRAGSPGSTLRLTRRGRVVVVVTVLLVAFGWLLVRSNAASSTDAAHHEPTATVVVTPGETVWDIAQRIEPGVDPRVVVAQIEQMNDLSDAGQVRVGEPLLVPLGR